MIYPVEIKNSLKRVVETILPMPECLHKNAILVKIMEIDGLVNNFTDSNPGYCSKLVPAHTPFAKPGHPPANNSDNR